MSTWGEDAAEPQQEAQDRCASSCAAAAGHGHAADGHDAANDDATGHGHAADGHDAADDASASSPAASTTDADDDDDDDATAWPAPGHAARAADGAAACC